MDAAQIANLAGSAFLAAAALTAATVYHLRTPWWRTWMGRHIMGVTVSVGLLGLYTLLVSLVWPTGPVASALRIGRTVDTVFLGVMMVLRVLLVIDAQRIPGGSRRDQRGSSPR